MIPKSNQTNEMSHFKVCNYFVMQAFKNICCMQVNMLPARKKKIKSEISLIY